jgi:hypothetical protein
MMQPSKQNCFTVRSNLLLISLQGCGGRRKIKGKKKAKIHILQGSKTTLGETTAKLVASIKLSSAMT